MTYYERMKRRTLRALWTAASMAALVLWATR